MADNEKKDLWDKSNILISLVIAAMVAYWGYSIDSRQVAIESAVSDAQIELQQIKAKNELANKDEDQEVDKLEAIRALIPYITKDEKTRKVALTALAELGGRDIALKISSIYDDEGSREISDNLMQISESLDQESVPLVATSKNLSKSSDLKHGWMYLGRFSERKWRGNYVDLDAINNLSDAKGKIVTVKENVAGLNVRTSYPSIFGRLRPIISTLTPGSKVRIGNEHHYTYNDFIWVNVEYSDSQS